LPGNDYSQTADHAVVVAAPPDIDITTAEQLRAALLDAARHGHATVVVDLTTTRFCDSAGLDLTTAGQLSALITRQLAGEAHQLTIDVSGLRFADMASIRTLVPAASTLKRRADAWSCCIPSRRWPGS